MKFGQGQINANRKGRPPTKARLKQIDFRNMFATRAPELINKCIDMALDGSEKCIQICIDRLVPRMRESEKSEGMTVLEMINAGKLVVDTNVEPVALNKKEEEV